MDSNTVPISNRRSSNQSAFDKKKRKKKKKKPKEGKRSSASSASASGSPDSSGLTKVHHSYSCPSILGGNAGNDKTQGFDDSKEAAFSQVNECLRWPAHSSYTENSFRSDVIGRFPVAGATEEEENERIAIYKMNRRKRYLSAQQALVNKYPDVTVYASSSGSSSGRNTNEDGLRIGSGGGVVPSTDKSGYLSENVTQDSRSHEKRGSIHNAFFANGDVSLGFTKSSNGVRQEIFSGV